uniref:Galectin n=1 Tax=Eptatretus burgeri TaxID=7764 RepID=A0A8C4NGH7_EPTBU
MIESTFSLVTPWFAAFSSPHLALPSHPHSSSLPHPSSPSRSFPPSFPTHSPPPPLPFSKPIPNGIRPGWRLVINGTVNANCERFVINLMASATNDKVLHFNPRFAQPGIVVRNSCINNNWGCEERDGGMPFHHLQRFEVRLFMFTILKFSNPSLKSKSDSQIRHV